MLGAALAAGGLAAVASADLIRLKDGRSYEGDIRPHPDGWVVTEPDGRRTIVARERVAGLEAKPKLGQETADQRLTSLRRAAEAMPEARQAVERYRTFVQQYAGTPAADIARADLKVWQDRVDLGYAKVGDKWVSEVDRKALLERSYDTAERAMVLLKAGRAADAGPLLDQAVAENAQNAAAWYLKGLLLFKQEKTVEARKAFEQASALSPDHAATHNNLAVVQWRQNQHVSALLSYEKALLAAPLHRTVLDNLAEALAGLPENLRDGTQVTRVVRHFNDQDLLLQQQMATQGLHRWGSSWVTKPELDKLQAVEREVRGRIDQLEAEYNAAARRVERLAADIKSTEATVRRMETGSVGYDAGGRLVRYPMPPSYDDFLRDLGAMKAERQQRVDEQQLMRKEARRLAQALPTPKYTGVQRLIELEGTPIFGRPNPPTAAPAVAAANAGQPPNKLAANVPPGNGAAAGPGQNPGPSSRSTGPAAAVTPPGSGPVTPSPPARAATRPAQPRPFVPPEKPSLMDRRLEDELPPRGSGQPPSDDPKNASPSPRRP